MQAPFNEEQIKSINEFQQSGAFHPFTCGSGRRTDADHTDGEGLLVATADGMICPFCDYRQDWVHDFMADGSWKKSPIAQMHFQIFTTPKPGE